MARLADQYRRSDVRLWGIVAAATTVLAVASLEAPAFVPDRIFAALHATRLPVPDSGVGEIRAQIAQLKDQQASLDAAGNRLAIRVGATEQDAGSMRHEVGALVANLPKLVKTVPIGNTGDDALVTGAIGLPKPGISGVSRQALNDTATALAVAKATTAPPAAESVAAPQPMPVDLQRGPITGSATASVVPRTSSMAVAPAAQTATDTTATSTPPPASRQSDLVAEIGAYEWAQPAMTMSNGASSLDAAPPVAAPAPPFAPAQASVSNVQHPAAGPVPLAPQRTLPATAAVASANPPAKADVRAVGVAIGAPVQPGNALAAWQNLASKVGVMLVGMSPLLAEDPAGGGGKVLVAGPVASIAAATALCGKVDNAGLTCTPMPYVGADLGPAQ